MPKYANNQEFLPKETSKQQAFRQGLSDIAQAGQAYKAQQNEEKYTATLLDPNSSPIQQALAWTKLKNPQAASAVIQQQTLAQKGALAKQVIGDTQKKIATIRGENVPATGNQPSVSNLMNELPGAEPARPPMMLPGKNAQNFQPNTAMQPQQNIAADTRRQQADAIDQAANQLDSIDPKAAAGLRHDSNQLRKDYNTDIKAAAEVEKAEIKTAQSAREQAQKTFENERSFETAQAKPVLDLTAKLRESIPRQKMALAMSREAVESKELNPFSRNHMSELPGLGWLKTASKAQLDIARKENLIGTLSKVSGRAQNMYLEKVAASAFPETGNTLETNLTAQELIEANLALDQATENIASQLEQSDLAQYGFVKGTTIGSRISQAMKPIEEEILQRTAYRVKILKDQEAGIEKLRQSTEKSVPKGTILTPQMARIFLEKTKGPLSLPERQKRAIQRAKQLGYTIISPQKAAEYEQ